MSHNIQELLSPNCALFFLFFLRNLFVNSTYWGIWLLGFRGFVVKISCPVSSEQHNVKQKEEQMWPQHKKYATMDTRTRPFISDQSLSFCRECFKCSQEILVPTSLLLIPRLILTSLQNMILTDQDPQPLSYKIATKTLPFIPWQSLIESGIPSQTSPHVGDFSKSSLERLWYGNFAPLVDSFPVWLQKSSSGSGSGNLTTPLVELLQKTRTSPRIATIFGPQRPSGEMLEIWVFLGNSKAFCGNCKMWICDNLSSNTLCGKCWSNFAEVCTQAWCRHYKYVEDECFYYWEEQTTERESFNFSSANASENEPLFWV